MSEDSGTPRKSHRVRWIISALFYTALIVFLALYLTTLDFESLTSTRVNWWIFALALAVGITNRYWMILIWIVLLNGLGATTRGKTTALSVVYAKSWLGRYIPGTAPWILGKIHFASQLGISKTRLAVSSLLEAGLQITVLLVSGLALIALDPRASIVSNELQWLMVGFTVVGVAMLLPPVFNRVFALAYRVIRRRTIDSAALPGFRTIGYGTALHVVGAMLAGLSMFLVARSLDPTLGAHDLLYLIAAMNLASAVSMIAVFAPSGIGVRETILVLLLGAVMSAELALLTAVVLRVWSIIADFAFLGVAATVRGIARQAGRP